MNYVLISPHFPEYQQNFALKLKARGVNVLGIGSEPYEVLSEELKGALTEYFRVNQLEDVEEVKRAVAFLFHKHGPIDRIESNNEHWLELDAQLREQFNVPGVKPEELLKTKYKSRMKNLFREAGVPVVDGKLVTTIKELDTAIKQFKLPIVAKPDRGVGTAATFKIQTKEDVVAFKEYWSKEIPYFVEPYVENADLVTFDGLIDDQGRIVFSTSFRYTAPTLELIEGSLDFATLVDKKVDPTLEKYGKAIVQTFGMKERFFHIEFFKLENGDYVALEYNNRLAGGYTIDLYNYSYSCDLYDIYAGIVTQSLEGKPKYSKQYGVGIALRDKYQYTHTIDEIRQQFGDNFKLERRYPRVFADIMGDTFLVITAKTKKEVDQIVSYVHQRVES